MSAVRTGFFASFAVPAMALFLSACSSNPSLESSLNCDPFEEHKLSFTDRMKCEELHQARLQAEREQDQDRRKRGLSIIPPEKKLDEPMSRREKTLLAIGDDYVQQGDAVAANACYVLARNEYYNIHDVRTHDHEAHMPDVMHDKWTRNFERVVAQRYREISALATHSAPEAALQYSELLNTPWGGPYLVSYPPIPELVDWIDAELASITEGERFDVKNILDTVRLKNRIHGLTRQGNSREEVAAMYRSKAATYDEQFSEAGRWYRWLAAYANGNMAVPDDAKIANNYFLALGDLSEVSSCQGMADSYRKTYQRFKKKFRGRDLSRRDGRHPKNVPYRITVDADWTGCSSSHKTVTETIQRTRTERIPYKVPVVDYMPVMGDIEYSCQRSVNIGDRPGRYTSHVVSGTCKTRGVVGHEKITVGYETRYKIRYVPYTEKQTSTRSTHRMVAKIYASLNAHTEEELSVGFDALDATTRSVNKLLAREEAHWLARARRYAATRDGLDAATDAYLRAIMIRRSKTRHKFHDTALKSFVWPDDKPALDRQLGHYKGHVESIEVLRIKPDRERSWRPYALSGQRNVIQVTNAARDLEANHFMLNEVYDFFENRWGLSRKELRMLLDGTLPEQPILSSERRYYVDTRDCEKGTQYLKSL